MGSTGGHLRLPSPRHPHEWLSPVVCVSPSPDVNYEELARCTDDFNGAQCKAVCVEAVSGGVRWVAASCLPAPFPGQDRSVCLVESAQGNSGEAEACGSRARGAGGALEPVCPGCRA